MIKKMLSLILEQQNNIQTLIKYPIHRGDCGGIEALSFTSIYSKQKADMLGYLMKLSGTIQQNLSD